ncbi:YbjQ family protein [Halomicrococcus sp. SG-WS-1]|uniref:YbjQ family protein n=1 Tax=Halomicrococcus sp. SG-WS-1 TaxID=3439057 RepID=UPI003F7A1711
MATFSYSDEDVLLTTSHAVPGREVAEHLGIVVADVTPGRNIGKDIAGGLRDIVGGRSGSWEKTLADSQQTALDELLEEATELGADAVVAIDVADEALGGQGGMMNVKVVGTAVRLD